MYYYYYYYYSEEQGHKLFKCPGCAWVMPQVCRRDNDAYNFIATLACRLFGKAMETIAPTALTDYSGIPLQGTSSSVESTAAF